MKPIAGLIQNSKLEYDWDETSVKVSMDGESIPAGGSLKLEVRAWTDLPTGGARFGTSSWEEGKLYHLQFCYPYVPSDHILSINFKRISARRQTRSGTGR